MKKLFSISLGLVLALSLSLFCSCNGGKNAVEILLKFTASGDASFANSAEKTMKFMTGDTVTVIATPKKDCDFFGWYIGKEKTPESKETKYTFIATESVTLVAKFGKSPVISLSSNDYGTAAFADSAEKSMVVSYGKTVNVVATPNADCEFVGWFVGDSQVSTDANYTFTSSKNTSLVAKFVKSPVVSISNSADGRVAFADGSKKSMAVLTGNNVTVVATPDKDCEFEGWYAGNSKVCAEPVYTFAVSKNISLVAKFYPSPVVSVSSNNNGSAAIAGSSDDAVVVLLGNDVTVTAKPNDHCEFDGWFVDDVKVSTDSVYTFAVSENTFVVAKFNPCPVVSISGSDNGRISFAEHSGKSVIVFSGTDVTVTATPDAGFELYGWFVGDSKTPASTDLIYTFAVDKNVKLYAEFRRSLNRHEYVDLGLPSGLKWATCNIGADAPEKSGAFFAWGETEEKGDYSWNAYKFYNAADYTVTEYCVRPRYGVVDQKTVLEAEDDVANVKWGASWRMPTWAEQEELYNSCTWEWTTLNDVPGYKITGPNGNSIFLPVTGYKNDDKTYNKNGGYYWTSTLIDKTCLCAYYMIFDGTECRRGEYARRCSGRAVRPVFE